MENVTDLSFSNDEIVPGAKPSGASQPMVVVQYRQRGVPWWLLSLLTVFAPICAILVYHSLVVGRYRAQAVESAAAFRTWLNNATGAESKKSAEPALPLALNSQPIPSPAQAGAAAVPSTGVPVTARDQAGGIASAVTAPGPVQSDVSPANGKAVPGPQAQEAPSSGVDRSVASSAVNPVAPMTQGPAAGSTGLPSSGVVEGVASKSSDTRGSSAPKPAVDRAPPNSSATATAALEFIARNQGRLPAAVRSPFDDPVEETDQSKSVRPGEMNPTGHSSQPAIARAEEKRPIGEPSRTAVPPAIPPLPTKEETLRQFEQEAAQNLAHDREMQEQKVAELRSFRYQERVKFRDELRAVLQQHGREAGPEINRLAQRSSYDTDPERLTQALHIWRVSRTSQPAKAKMIRALDLPETVILDFLSDDFHTQVRTRNGPRNENEVRIRAAQQLLRLELPPEEQMPAVHAPADTMPGRTLRSRIAPFPGAKDQRGR
jgi:hypothetical protein